MRPFSSTIQGLGLDLLALVLFPIQVLAAPQLSLPVKLNPILLNPTTPTPISTINPILLNPVFQLDDTFKIKDAVLTNGIDLTIRYPRDILTLSKSFGDRSNDLLRASLPNTLQQFNIPSDQIQGVVDTGVPLLMNAIQELLSEEQPTANGLHRRSFLGDLFGWAKDAGCALVAAAGLPLFLLAAADFGIENSDGISTTPEQDFFLYPMWANLAHDGPVTIYYAATRPPFFKGTSGTTFNRNIFTALTPVTSFSESTFQEFEVLVQTLIHEFTHVDQYRQKGYDIAAFGYEYLFQWCSNGGYSAITLEVDAYAQQTKMNGLLLFDAQNQLGNQFFQVWRTQNLGPLLGNPIAQTYTTTSNIRELPFQRGLMQITDGPCFRTFNSDEASIRARSDCNPNAKCLDRRDAMRGPGNDPPIPCDPEEKEATKKACTDAKAAWSSLNGRGWTCDLKLPVPGAQPPPQKPGCPPGCDIIPHVSHTSKSCQFDDPPLGCDWEAADQNNAECRAEQARCAA